MLCDARAGFKISAIYPNGVNGQNTASLGIGGDKKDPVGKAFAKEGSPWDREDRHNSKEC